MAAPRATQFIALRNLARGSHQIRSLHMTGPATYASPVLTKERPVLNLPRDIASLRVECKRRRIEAHGNKQDLISRLHAHELANSRAFSTAAATGTETKRPSATTEQSSASALPTRHFNTSRSLKHVNDSSTIDFAYFPDLNPDDEDATAAAAQLSMRVPIIPTNFSPVRTGAHAPEAEDMIVMKPTISTISADAVVFPMAEMSDDHAMNIDFHDVADRVATGLRRMVTVPVIEQQAGLVKRIWGDMVDDVLAVGGAGGKKVAL